MDLTYSFAIGFALSQVALALALLTRSGFNTIQQRLFGFLLLAVFGYFTVRELSVTPLGFVASAFKTAVPGAFWLFNASLFDDHFRLKPWKIGLVGVTVMLPAIATLIDESSTSLLGLILIELPQLLEFVLLSLALLAIARYWRIDLVQSRRQLRLWLSGFNGVYIFIIVLFEQLIFPNERWVSDYQYITSAIALLITNLLLLRVNDDLLNPLMPVLSEILANKPAVVEAKTELAEPSAEFIEQLRAVMEDRRLYTEMGLTIGQLAKELDIQEYKLRQMINSQLGYRNFSDFLNSYRIKETADRLRDETNKHLPILTIALDVGFRSLSSFNKAFKATFGQTPTEYRRLNSD
ncbi:MAG: AraC-like DNA-binding protein [Pseudomonadales bacterium]|jgi:AraC-like DNA-binding protein